MPKTQVLNFPSKFLLVKDMFTLTLVELVYETSFSIWEFEVRIVQNDNFAFILPRFTIKFTEKYETEFINEL